MKKKKKNVLVIGSGGREHALAWKISQSPKVGKLYIAPGNGGTQLLGQNLSIKPSDVDGLVDFANNNNIDITIIGPDDLLAAGIVNFFQEQGLRVFGPTLAAAQIEASKAFAKKLMGKAKIPTASFKIFKRHEYDEAWEYIQNQGVPIVVKASGLALGKGVYPCKTLEEAEDALKKIMVERVHGVAGDEIVIEEYLEGQEISIHAFCDGESSSLMLTSQDHKPIFDGDQGPNTGGMGTFAPVPWITQGLIEKIGQTIVRPALNGLAEQGHPFMGCLYPGLKITEQGPKVLEFNARFGDPETQSYMRLLKTDLLDIVEACVDKRLNEIEIEWKLGFAVCVVVASGGYPGKYKKGIPIYGIEMAEKIPGVVIFHAGTVLDNKQFETSSGRVLSITAVGETLQIAIDRAYRAVNFISFEGMYYRTDIGAKAFK
jgi:phosphoribosylamine--glycine ligase